MFKLKKKYWYLLLHCSERSIQECCSVN